MQRLALAWVACSLAAAPLLAADATRAATPIHEPLYPIWESGRWGLIDQSGNVVAEPRFATIGGWGGPFLPAGNPTDVTDAAAAHADITGARPTNAAVLPVRLNGQTAVWNRDGRVLAQGRYERLYIAFQEGLIQAQVGGRWGFADERGALAIPATYDRAQPFEEGFAFVQVGNRWGVIDRSGRTMVDPTWDQVEAFPGDRWARVRVGNRWGAVERSGEIVIPVRFDSISRPLPPLIFAVAAGQPVYLRPDGSTAFSLKCPKGRGEGHPFFGNDAAIVSCGERDGLIDTAGNFLLAPKWDLGPFYDGRAVVRSGDRTGLVDTKGRFVVEIGKLNVGAYSEGLAFFSGPKQKLGFIDIDGNVVIPPAFDWVSGFSEGLSVVRSGGKSGYIDRTGSWAIEPRFCVANSFHGPLATVERPATQDSIEVAYLDRAGKIVHRMQFPGLSTRMNIEDCRF